MPNLYTFNNPLVFGTHREETRGGKDWLVVNGVPLVEGVLKNYLVPMEEFGKFTHDWNGVPIVLRHPSENGGSAKTPDVDVPILGSFYQADVDNEGRRLTGEFWFDKAVLMSTEEGKELHDRIVANKMIELSTGYFAGMEGRGGEFKGRRYTGIHRNIHPDHIAVLPDVTGACSISDGCGLNRNDSVSGSMCANCDGCSAKRAINHMKGESITERMSLIGDAFRKGTQVEATFGKPVESLWITDYFDDHIIVSKSDSLFRVNYSMKGDKVTFDAMDRWTEVRRKNNYVPVTNDGGAGGAGSKAMGGGYAGKSPKMKALWDKVYKRAKADGDDDKTAAKKANGACKRAGMTKNDSGEDQDFAVSERAALAHNSQKERKPMNKTLLAAILKAAGYTAVFNEDDEDGENQAILSLATPTNNSSPALPEELVDLTSYLKETGGVSAFKEALTQNAQSITALRESLGEDMKTVLNEVRSVVNTIRAEEDAEKTALIKNVMTEVTTFTEDELKGMPLAQLRKFANALNIDTVDYGVAGGVITHGAEDEGDFLPPAVLTAPLEKAKADGGK